MQKMAQMNIPDSIIEVLYRLNVNRNIEPELLADAFKSLLNIPNEGMRDILLNTFLTGIMIKGPEEKEIVTLLKVAFSLDHFDPLLTPAANKLPPGKLAVATVGSGKKGIKTINISTSSALVAASLGAHIIKPGSFSVSSVTGSADFMYYIGANFNLTRDRAVEVLHDVGFVFLSIENLIPKFDEKYGRRFHVPHVLSFALAGLLTPIKSDRIVYGLAHSNVELSIKVLREFGIKDACVISSTPDGIHFMDEINVFGSTKIIRCRDGMLGTADIINSEVEYSLPKYSVKDIAQGKEYSTNITYVLNALKGKGKPAYEDLIAINAGNLLYISEKVENIREGYYLAKKCIKTGLPYEKLEQYIEVTGGQKKNLVEFNKAKVYS
ncbi:Anthranilate phosphoribosyltransferase [compost metagenome]